LEADIESSYIGIEPFTFAYRMGQLVHIPGRGTSTIGHPFDSGGARFFSSFHFNGGSGLNAFFGAPGNPSHVLMGRVAWSTFNVEVDVAAIDTSVIDHRRVSPALPSPWPAGSTINNFRGTPRSGDPVRSIRGMSNLVHHTIIFDPSFTLADVSRAIMTDTNGRSQAGDSGAALITVAGQVVGTRAGWIRWMGVDRGVYTNVQFYR